jgi:Arc/MetJ-type ribon-helix-helix transcriptional regulator
LFSLGSDASSSVDQRQKLLNVERLNWTLQYDIFRGDGAAAFESDALHAMVFGMATTKITITLRVDQVEEIRALVAAGQAASVSAFVKHAVGVALFDAAGWRQMLKHALRQTGGPLTKKERAWADALLSS